MTIEVTAVPSAALAEYARIPIAFEVNAVFEVGTDPGDDTGFRLWEHPIETPHIKDYDTIAERPDQWADRFDTSKWALLIARVDGLCVGGAAVAFDTPGLDMLEGRTDLLVLWDIRVVPEWRRQGVGTALLRAAEVWGLSRGCRQVKIETQNVNVAACRFYARHGCVLRAAHHGAYPGCPGEIQLLWYKDLAKD